MSEQVPAGWYPDPKMAGTQRYWNGTDWTERAAPMAPAAPKPTGTLTIARGVALGVIVAVIAVVLWVNLSGPSDLECITNDLQVRTGDAPKNYNCP